MSAEKPTVSPNSFRIGLVVGLLALYLVFQAAVPFLRVPEGWRWAVSALVVSPLFLCLHILIVYRLSVGEWRRRVALLVLLVCGAPFALIGWRQFNIEREEQSFAMMQQEAGHLVGLSQITGYFLLPYEEIFGPGLGTLPAFMLLTTDLPPLQPPPPRLAEKLFYSTVGKVLLLFLLVALGQLASRIIRELNLLVPAAPIAAVVDMFSVLTPVGPTRQALENMPYLVPLVSQTIPTVGTQGATTAPIGEPFAFIGPGDTLFLAFYFACLARFGVPIARTAVAMCVALTLYLGVVLVFGHVRLLGVQLDALPALVPMALVILWVNRREFKMTRDEKLMSAIVWLVALGLLAVAFTLPR